MKTHTLFNQQILLFVLLISCLPVSVLADSLSEGVEAYNNKDYPQAEKIFGEEAQRNPSDAAAAYGWGNSLYQQGKFPEAQKAYEQVLGQKPNLESAWYNLGNSYVQQQRYKDALEAYQKAHQLDPKDMDVEHNLNYAQKKLNENPSSDRSDEMRKEEQKQQAMQTPVAAMVSPEPTLVTPVATMVSPVPTFGTPPPDRKNEQEDENSDNKVKDPNAKKKYQSQGKSNQAMQDKNAKQQMQQQQAEQKRQQEAAQQRQQDAQRQEEAKKQMGLTDDQVKNLMAQLQKQEGQAQHFYSPRPDRERKKQQNDIWNFLPRENQEFMKKFFGGPSGDKDQPAEDW